MILVALGANLPGPWGTPRHTVSRALDELDRDGLRLVAVSRLLETAPYGKLNQPAFVNAVARIETHRGPQALLRKLHTIERAAGRHRAVRWGPRSLDLDLLDYHGTVLKARGGEADLYGLVLPHPGIADRLFVLAPLAEIAPEWRHPILRATASELLHVRARQPGRAGSIIGR